MRLSKYIDEVSLLRGMMTVDPAQRMTLAEIKKHIHGPTKATPANQVQRANIIRKH